MADEQSSQTGLDDREGVAARVGKEELEFLVKEPAGELAVNEALRRSETQLQTLFDEAPLGVYLVDADFRIRRVNTAALPVFGNIPDLIGRDFDEVIHILWSQAYADELVERFKHTLETGQPYFVAERIEQRRDRGVTEYYEWQINRITLPEGGYGVVCYFRDVSAAVLARQAIAESEEKYRTLFEAIDEGFCTVEVMFDQNERPVDYRYLQVNPSFERQTGVANAVGKTMREIAPRHEEHWFETYGRVALTGEPARFENQSAQLGRWYDVYAFRVGDPQLRRIGILFKDITERKRMEIDLQFQARVLGQVNDAVIAVDSRQRISYFNQAAERQYGVESGWALGRPLREVYKYRWVRPEDEAESAEALANAGFWRGENIHVRRDGTMLPVESAVSQLKNEAGEVAGLLAVIRDFTERKRAEESRRRAAELDAFRVALADALRPLSDPVQIQAEACRLLGEHLGVDRAYYVEVNEAEGYARVERDYLRGDSPSLAGTFRLADYGWTVPYHRRGETIVVADVETSDIVPEAARAAMEAIKIAAHISAPLVKENMLAGALCVTEPAPREWSETEIELVRETAERIWASVERARAEEALRRSRERMRRVLETDAVGVVFFDQTGTLIDANHAFLEMTGYSLAEVEARELSWRRLTAPEWIPESEAQIAKLEATGRLGPYEKEYILKDGSRRWMLFAGRDLGDGTISEYCIDVSDRKWAEERLRASEERLRLLIESAEDYAIFTVTPDNRINYWNAGAERMFGYREEEILGRSGATLFTPEDRERGVPEQEIRTVAAEGRVADERWHVSRNGTRFYSSGVMTPLRHGGVLRGFVKIARDLTAQKRAEEELRRAHDELEERVRERTLELAEANVSLGEEVSERRAAEEQIKKLLKQLVTVQEEERLRIARNIHDQMGQQMSALRMNLSSLHARCDGETEPAEQSRRTLALAEELDQSIDFLTWELRPAALDHLGLSAALANLVRGWSERFHITAEYHASGVDSLRLPPDSEINLYRLAQEALHNVYKHAGATNVGVFLERRGGHVVLIVEDDGRGFDPEEVSHDGDGAGMGLIGMRERAALVGGELDVESSPGGGTAVYVRVLLTLSGEGEPGDE